MTPAAQKYFRLYYRLERLVEEEKSHSMEAYAVRKELDIAYEEMTEKEKQLLDIVDKKSIKEI
jgi:hypothetical protein